MLAFVSEVMGIIDYKVFALVIYSIKLVFYDGSLSNNGNSGATNSVFYG